MPDRQSSSGHRARSRPRGVERIANGLFGLSGVRDSVLFLTDFPARLVPCVRGDLVWLYWISALTAILPCAAPSSAWAQRISIGRWRNVIVLERWYISPMFIRRNLFNPLQLVLMRRSGTPAALNVALALMRRSLAACGTDSPSAF